MHAWSSYDNGAGQYTHGAAMTTAHGNARAAADAANGNATIADEPVAGDGDYAALARAWFAVTGGPCDGNMPPASDANDSNVTVPCTGSSEWRQPWYSQ